MRRYKLRARSRYLRLVLLMMVAVMGSTGCSDIRGETAALPGSTGTFDSYPRRTPRPLPAGDYLGYPTVAALIADSSLIFVGNVMNSESTIFMPIRMTPDDPYYDDPIRNPQYGLSDEELDEFFSNPANGVRGRITSIAATEILRGTAAVGDIIQINETGNTVFDIGLPYLLFARECGEAYCILGGFAGIFYPIAPDEFAALYPRPAGPAPVEYLTRQELLSRI